MINTKQIELKIKELENCDKNHIFEKIDYLVSNLELKDSLKIFSMLITHKDFRFRECAAYALGEIGDNSSISLLKIAYQKAPDNRKSRYVYALRNLDCSEELEFLLDVFLEGNFEVSNHALDIIDSQNYRTQEKLYTILNEKIEKYTTCEKFDVRKYRIAKDILKESKENK